MTLISHTLSTEIRHPHTLQSVTATTSLWSHQVFQGHSAPEHKFSKQNSFLKIAHVKNDLAAVKLLQNITYSSQHKRKSGASHK